MMQAPCESGAGLEGSEQLDLHDVAADFAHVHRACEDGMDTLRDQAATEVCVLWCLCARFLDTYYMCTIFI